MCDNPMKAPVLRLLRENPDGLSEYQIITGLKKRGLYIDDLDDPSMTLFTGHFMVMNALYSLQRELLAEGWWLSVSPLSNRLVAAGATGGHGALQTASTEAALADYYLDWNNLDTMTPAGVERLLDGFWQRFEAGEASGAALATLGLDATAGWPEIRAAYRRLAATHHPDKGGDAARFIEIREAYLVLKRRGAGKS